MQQKFEQLDNCLYCGSDRLSRLFAAPDRFGTNTDELHSVVRCVSCNLVFQNPRVKEEYIGTYYGDDLHYYHIPSERKLTLAGRIKRLIETQTLIEYFNYRHLGKRKFWLRPLLFPFKKWQRVKLTPRFVPSGTILDIGCSHGAYLVRMRELGWNVVGQEMHEKSAEYARSMGIPVTGGRIEDTDFPPESFDVIAMNMVLEHVYDPFAVLRQITRWLKPNGTLVFAIPYFEGTEFKAFKEYSFGLQMPCHITFLTKTIIKKYLADIRYGDIRFYFHFFDRDMAASAQFRYRDRGGALDRLVGENKMVRQFIVKPLVWFLSALHLTSRITVFATKRL
jgi:2-polyprenyl-3-methyl-5-hydroxy-6-metoxy-1,4-benzoquinol methylase